MKPFRVVGCLAAALALGLLPACGPGPDKPKGQQFGKYRLIGPPPDYTYLDLPEKETKCLNNAQDALTTLQQEKDVCLVGLWAYEPPQLLTAAGANTSIKIVGFDEAPGTLDGVANGRIYGTIVQNPYQFGYKSVKIMAALAKGKVAFVSNNVDPFWSIARAGAEKAAAENDVGLVFRMPDPGDAATQKEVIDTVLNQGVKAIAVSVTDPTNQTPYFKNDIVSRVPLITQDNDAPDSGRVCYIGTDNYEAGRAAGRLVKEAMPDGGVVAIFVGNLSALNAIQRRQGLLDELAGKPDPVGEDATVGDKEDKQKAVASVKGDDVDIVGDQVLQKFRIITKDGGKAYNDTVHGIKTTIPVKQFRDDLSKTLGKPW
jgi:ribose transport system substrate-binding protein